jgi:chitinase
MFLATSVTPHLAAQSPRFEQLLPNTEPKQLWVGGYVPGWKQARFDLKNDRGFEAVTHLLHFAVYFGSEDGGLDLRANELTPAKTRAIVNAAHSAHKKVLLVVGGQGARPGLRVATAPARLQETLVSILAFLQRYRYDGIDIDWEPLPPADTELYASFVEGLRRELDRAALAPGRKLLLTTAIEVNLNDQEYMNALLETLRKLDRNLDQINLMTYAMATPANVPFVWHNSALFPDLVSLDLGLRRPSADGAIREFFTAGFQPGKLGIGINLNGYLWQGQSPEDIAEPGKLWKVPPKVKELSCGELAKYSAHNPTRWDEQAEVPYISMPRTNELISYEDRRGIEAKLEYVRRNDLGGVIIWDIGGDRREERAKQPLLRAINDGLFLSRPVQANQIAFH